MNRFYLYLRYPIEGASSSNCTAACDLATLLWKEGGNWRLGQLISIYGLMVGLWGI